MSENTRVGGVYYEVSMETRRLIDAQREVDRSLNEIAKSADKTDKSIDGLENSMGGLSKAAGAVSTALKMPEVNRLSTQLAQLSGKIGASTESAIEGAAAHTRFSGALSTVARKLGAGYVSNIGGATSALIHHTKEALSATAAQLDNAIAAKTEAMALQGAASQLVINATAEKKAAEAAVKTAESELQVAEAVFTRKEGDIASLEALLTRQKESLKQAESNLQITNSEKAVKDAIQARSAVDATQAKILKQSNQAVKEVTAAEDKAKAAKVTVTAASEKLSAAMALEATALATVGKANDAVALSSSRLTLAAKAQAVAITGARSALALLGGPTGVLLLAAAGVYALYQAMGDNTSIDDYRSKIDEAVKKLDELTSKQAKAAAAQATLVIKADSKELDKVGEKLSVVQAQISYMEQNPDDWKENNLFSDYNKVIDDLRNKLALLGGQQDDLSGSIDKTTTSLTKFNQAAEAGPVPKGDAAKSARILAETNAFMAKQQNLLTEATSKGAQAAELLAFRQELENRYAQQGITITDNIAQSIDRAVAAKKELLSSASQATFNAQLKAIQQNVEALKIEMTQGAEAAAVYRAQLALQNAGIIDPKKVKEYTDAIREQAKVQKQVSESRKSNSKSKTSKADNSLERQQNQVAALRKEYELLTTGTSDVTREMAIFNAVQSLGSKATDKQKREAAAEAATLFDLKQKVDDFRTAAEITPELKISKAFADEAKELQRLFSAGLIDEKTFKELGAKAKADFNKGMAEATVAKVVSPLAENRGEIDPITALANQNAQKLALMNQYYLQEQAALTAARQKNQLTETQYQEAKLATDAQYQALITAQNAQFEQQRTDALWTMLSQQGLGYDMLTSAVDAFAGNASNALTGLITGSMSAEEAMRSLGSTMLNSVVNSLVQVGVEALKNFIIAQTIGNAGQAAAAAAATAAGASALAAWTPAAIAASIATLGSASGTGLMAYQTAQASGMALSIAGMRKNGGPVQAGNMYEFGEGGMFEALQMGGKNYLLPGNNGRVISNKDLMKDADGRPQIRMAPTGKQYVTPDSSGKAAGERDAQAVSNIIINLTNIGTPQEVVDQQATKGVTGQEVIEIIMADVRNSGPASRALANKMGTKLRPTGE